MKRTSPYKTISVAVIAVLAVLFIFPLYWILTGSVKDAAAINAAVPQWFPLEPTTDNYIRLFSNPALRWLFNSVFMAVMAMILTCITASMAGYALAKKRFVGKQILFSVFICAMALPKQVILIPLLKEMAFLNLHDNLWAVILPTVGWPFGVFLMKQFSEGIPGELLEAARIDGANSIQQFFKITIPLLMPAITTCTIGLTTGALKTYDILVTSTEGGPGRASTSIIYYLYTAIFEHKQYGYGSSIAVTLIILLLVIALVQLKFFKKKEVQL